MPYKDSEKRKEYSRKYNLLNKEKINKASKEYYYANKEELLARSKQYYEEHKEEIKEVNKKYYEENKEIIAAKHRLYFKEYYVDNKDVLLAKGREHFKKHKEYHANRTKNYRHERADWLLEIKSKLSCIKCGEKHSRCLDFHHRDASQKDGLVSKIVKKWSKERVLEEIAKCDVLCANCHRKHHCENKDGWEIGELEFEGVRNTPEYHRAYLFWVRKKRTKWFWDLKKKHKCSQCDERDPACLDFHHKNSTEKEDTVSKMVCSALSEERILAETAICGVMCSNCHRKHHLNENVFE